MDDWDKLAAAAGIGLFLWGFSMFAKRREAPATYTESDLKPMREIPIVRIADTDMSRMMAQFVLAAVLRHYRDFVPFARAQKERRWHYIHPREAASWHRTLT